MKIVFNLKCYSIVIWK